MTLAIMAVSGLAILRDVGRLGARGAFCEVEVELPATVCELAAAVDAATCTTVAVPVDGEDVVVVRGWLCTVDAGVCRWATVACQRLVSQSSVPTPQQACKYVWKPQRLRNAIAQAMLARIYSVMTDKYHGSVSKPSGGIVVTSMTPSTTVKRYLSVPTTARV